MWCRQFSYDNSGNLTVAGRSPAGSNSWDVATFSAKNQALPTTSWGYDLAGNLTQALGVTIQYDAENRQVAYGATTYVYDGLGNRVEKIDSSNNVTTYVYDAFGNLAAEYGGSATITPGTQYLTMDALGSTRLVMTGASASERHDFQPFGLEDFGDSGTWRAGIAGYNVDAVRQKFTGQERDNESYLDFFQARYFSGIQGRFTSPDPGNVGANPADPQSWNGYGYVSGTPLGFTDPSGKDGEATAIGCLGGPAGCVIGAAVDILGALFAFGAFGGGSHTDLSSVAWTPTPQQPTPWYSDDSNGAIGFPDSGVAGTDSLDGQIGIVPPPDPGRFSFGFAADPSTQIQSWYQVVLAHVTKIALNPNSQAVPHWRGEIANHIRQILNKAQQVTKGRRAGAIEKYLQRTLGVTTEELDKMMKTPIILINPCIFNPRLPSCRTPEVM